MKGLAQSVSDAFQAFDDARQFDQMEAVAGDTAAVVELERPGARIGRYDLIERIGEGGFGVVWRAAQALPMRREVALKIIKPGMDSCEVIARFQAERQALAVMDHPHIAKVFDAGTTPTGRPFFVMELCRGEPITKYCARLRLPLEKRLELFAGVCHAVQHAHQKGILHRDLKPSNLLVTELDRNPVVKIIDFGIAKMIGAGRLTEHTLVTHAGHLIGTPAYMSPEQAAPGMDVDTRSDVYSLGVLLYELLTGVTPFTSEEWLREFADRPDSASVRDPLRPSVRLRSFSPEALEKVAAERQTDGARLIGLVKGDLDWIATKALERDRTRRFDSADALAADLERHLRREPVSARPPTASYLLRRYAQRHRVAVGAGAAVALALLAGTAVSTSLYLKQRTALAQSQQVSRFLKKLLSQAGTEKSLGRDDAMLRDILDEAATSLKTELAGQPVAEAELRGVIAETYRDLGQYKHSLEQATLRVDLLRQQRQTGGDDYAQALLDYGSSLEALGRVKEAEAALRESLAIRQRLFGDRDIRTASVHSVLAWTLLKSGRPLEGEASAKLAVEVWRQHPLDDRLCVAAKALYAIYHNTNRHAESIALMEEELQRLRDGYGPEHPDIMNCLDNLGVELTRVKRFDEAEPLLQEARRQGDKLYHGRNPVAYHIYGGLVKVAAARQQWDLQLHYARGALAAAKVVAEPGDRTFREGCNTLAGVLLEQAERQIDEAGRLSAQPKTAQAPIGAALAHLEELTGSPELAANAKGAGAWIDCLRGAALARDSDRREEARALLTRGLEAMSKKAKPTTEETRRIKKAEKWVARD